GCAAGLASGGGGAGHRAGAEALRGAGDQARAAGGGGHWAAAGRAAEELPARVVAAEAAERVFGYAEAAAHWQRAIELYQQLPGAAQAADAGLPRLYLRAIDALDVAGGGAAGGAPGRGDAPPPRARPPRGCPPPRRLLPGARSTRCRAPTDQGGAAAVRAAAAVGRAC